MRLLWIYTLALAILVAFVLQGVHGDADQKRGPGGKGVAHRDGVDAHRYHPDPSRNNNAPGSRGNHHSPSGDRSGSHSRSRDRGHSSSSDRHRDRAGHKDRKHKNKKQHKGKHNQQGQGKPHHRSGKNSHQ